MQQAASTQMPLPSGPQWDTLFSFAGGAAGGGITFLAQGAPSTLNCLSHYADFTLHTVIGATVGVLVQKAIHYILRRKKGGQA